ncbi:MAG: hypothetical protein JWN70_830 [Planctomycetaceae bacterium]|nr:hypothetical protein [Planctomycetaceae bacterium]
MTKMSDAGRCRPIVLVGCAVWALLVFGCWWPITRVPAQETPPAAPAKEESEKAAANEKKVDKAVEERLRKEVLPPNQGRPAEVEKAAPVWPNLLKRLILGGSSDSKEDAAEDRKRKRIDPRAPFNQKLSALLKKAQTQLKAGESRQALETLQRLLEMPEDALCEASPGKLVSVRSAAHRLLAKLPAADLERYRSQYGALAKRELAAATASGSPAALAQVATRYFQTESGFQAANLLASRYLDRGEFGLAAFWLRELLESRAPLTAEPVWRLKAEYVANKIESPALKKLLGKHVPAAGEKVVLGGQPVDRALWLTTLGQRSAVQTPTLQDWPQFFGSARRVGQAAAGEPLLLPRWSHPMTLSLAIRERVKELISDLRDDDQIPIFTFNPLLVDGKIIFRSLRGVKVVAADTGKLLWETSDEPAVEDVLAAISARDSGNGQIEQLNLPFGQAQAVMLQQDLEEAPVSDHPLTHLLFRNANHGLLSSDSKRLFVIEDLSVMTNLQPGQYWGEDLPESDPLGRPLGINRLTAYDLQTGRSTWEVGGPSLNDPFELPLAGTFFFGAPVVDGRDLFVVAEKDGQIRLQALDAVNGKPRWSQLIAHSQAKISMDVGRQWLSAPVAVGDGVIVCPTTVGWIVAIDRSTHGILWAYRYQDLNSQSEAEPQDEALQPAELNERWAAAPPVIVGDRVLFTPPEESRLICLSLSDGQLVWSEPRNSALFLAGVFGDEAVVVYDQSIRSINIKQPNQRRTLKFKTEDARPAGRGVAVQDRYYLPLTSGELLAINLKTFQLESTSYLPASADPEMTQFGNLAMYRGMLISLSPQGLVAFEPKLSIEAELQQQLTADPQSAPAAVRKAELELLHRHYPAAREVLQKVRADELTGELRQRYRAAVVTTLSALVREDLAARDAEFDDLARLADQPMELQALEILRAERLISRRDFAGAFRVYSQFAETHGGELVVPQEASPWKVKGERWAAGKIEELLTLAPPEVRTKLDLLIQNAGVAVLALDREHQQRFLNLFGVHPATAEIRKKLTATLSAAGEWQAAENLLVDLQADPQHRIWATERLGGLWQQAGLSADAAHFYQILERDHAAAAWDDSHTVSQHIQELRAAGRMPEAETKPICDWHNRELTSMRAGSNFDGGGIHKDINQQGSGLPFFRQHRLQFVSQEPRFEVIDARSEKKIWSLPIRTSSESASNQAHVNVAGHQVVLYQGSSITALSPTERRVLWSHVVDDHSAAEEIEDGLGDYRVPYPMRRLASGSANSAQFGGEAALGDDWATFATEGTTRFGNQHYVCYLLRRRLVVLDARTGKVAWTRASLPIGTQLLGGPNVIYAWNPAQDSVTAYAAVDGRDLNVLGLGELCKKSIGRVGDDFIRAEILPVAEASKSANFKLVRFDPLHKVARWSLELPVKTLASSLSGNRLVLADPQGQLQMCNLETGAVRPCGKVPTSALRSNSRIYTIPTYDQLLVVTHRDDKFPNDRSIDSFPAIRVNGMISAFDLATGNEQWKQSISGLHLILEQLDHSPIVLCLARVFEPNGEGSSVKWLVLAIDRQHGQIVHQSESQVQASFHQMSVNMLDEVVELKTYNDRLRLVPKSK